MGNRCAQCHGIKPKRTKQFPNQYTGPIFLIRAAGLKSRNLLPIRGSEPMPLRTASMSAPTTSHRRASSFMKLIRVASIAFAAYFVSSAEATSITWMRSFVRRMPR